MSCVGSLTALSPMMLLCRYCVRGLWNLFLMFLFPWLHPTPKTCMLLMQLSLLLMFVAQKDQRWRNGNIRVVVVVVAVAAVAAAFPSL
jgi:hypothetical protein